jgi:hypothetical protein
MAIFNSYVKLPEGNIWLVVSTNPSEKYEFVKWDDYSQYMGKKINELQTTNQIRGFLKLGIPRVMDGLYWFITDKSYWHG